MNETPNNLRVFMAARGFTQTALAKAVGTDASHICQISLGGVQPSLPMAKRIAKALNASIDVLFCMPPLEFAKQLDSITIKRVGGRPAKTRSRHASGSRIQKTPASGACPNNSQAESVAAGAA